MLLSDMTGGGSVAGWLKVLTCNPEALGIKSPL